MSDNKTTEQVGGTHYATDYQQWHWAADLGLRYFEGNITRYVCRHGKKNGEEDLKKSLHWARELLKLHNDGVIHEVNTDHALIVKLTNKLSKAYGLNATETSICGCVALWKNDRDLEEVITLINKLIEESYPLAGTV